MTPDSPRSLRLAEVRELEEAGPGTPAAIERLFDLTADSASQVRAAAIDALARLATRTPAVVDSLLWQRHLDETWDVQVGRRSRKVSDLDREEVDASGCARAGTPAGGSTLEARLGARRRIERNRRQNSKRLVFPLRALRPRFRGGKSGRSSETPLEI
jgi:hypothetical protein